MRYQTATQWGVYEVEVVDGKIRQVHNYAGDPDPSPLGQALLDGVQHPLRITQPHIRRGWLQGTANRRQQAARGADEFVPVPWDEALDMGAEEIRRIIAEHGNTAIYGGSYGWASAGRFHHAQSQLHRFINLLGGCVRAMNSYSTAAAQVILPHVVAPWHTVELEQPSWRELARDGELVVAFGGLPLRNTQVAYGGITEHQSGPGLRVAAEQGVEFVSVSPTRGDTPPWLNNQWLACRPGTDVALMLGIAYVLETEQRLDRTFLSSHCVGYDQFSAYLLGARDGVAKTPAWAEAICQVPADEIVALARKMAAKRTFVTAAWSLQRAHHGEQPYWMVVTLAAMLGQVGLPGGGFGFGYGAEGFVGSHWRRFNWATLSKGRNPTQFAIPVARIADLLLQPGETIDYNGQSITYPHIEMVYWAGGNPFHHHQDLNRLVQAWRKPATVMVNEPWWTPTAQWADIVFPATTALERTDICASSHDPYVHLMEPALTPQYDARSDHEIFKGLAHRLGVDEAFVDGKDEQAWLRDMWERSATQAEKAGFELPGFDDFVAAKQHKIPELSERATWLGAFRADPEQHPLSTPSGRIEIYSDYLAGLDYADCAGHPAWFEPFERLGGKGSDRFPLHLLTPQPEKRLHSQLDHSRHSQDSKIDGKEVMLMHPSAAAARGIKAGDVVRVFNDRGACLAGVQLDDQMLKDVVMLPTGAWFKPESGVVGALELNGNPNVLTADIGTSSLAQGPSANTCLVQVELFVH